MKSLRVLRKICCGDLYKGSAQSSFRGIFAESFHKMTFCLQNLSQDLLKGSLGKICAQDPLRRRFNTRRVFICDSVETLKTHTSPQPDQSDPPIQPSAEAAVPPLRNSYGATVRARPWKTTNWSRTSCQPAQSKCTHEHLTMELLYAP